MELSLFCDTYIIAEFLRLKRVLDSMPRYKIGTHNGLQVIREYSGKGNNITIKTAHPNSKGFNDFQKRLEISNKYLAMKTLYINEIKKRHLIIPANFDFMSDKSKFDAKYWDQAIAGSNSIKNESEYKDEYGFNVRSRGEIIVGNALKALGLDAKYETSLTLNNGNIKKPDYVFPVRIINRCFFVEFIGMTDNVEYMNRNYGKIDDYMRNGILPNRDLILICGTEKWIPTQSEMMRIIASFINNSVLRTYK